MNSLPIIFTDKTLFSNLIDYDTLAAILIFVGFISLAYSLRILNGRKRKGVSFNNRDLSDEAYQDALKILDRARADSLKILGRAQSKAQGVLSSTYSISKESREKLDKNLQNIYEKQERSLSDLTRELLESYKSAVEGGKEENIRTLYEATESMKKEALKGVTELKEVIKRETLEARGQLEGKIKSEYESIEQEIDVYKTEKLKNLNDKVFDILANVYAEVIKQDLDQIKHEKLIISLLKDELRKSGLKRTTSPGTGK
jgi:hypothetical protein